MSGIFDYLFNGQGMNGGLLPSFAPTAAPGLMPPMQTGPSTYTAVTPQAQAAAAAPKASPIANFGQSLTNWLQQNPSMIAALASGIGGAPTMRMGLAQAAGALPQAEANDLTFRTQQGQKAAIANYFKDPAVTKGMSAQQIALLQSDPTLAESYLANTMVPKLPTWGVISEDPYSGTKQYGWINQFSQNVTPGTTPNTPSWLTPGGGATGGAASVSAPAAYKPPDLSTLGADGWMPGVATAAINASKAAQASAPSDGTQVAGNAPGGVPGPGSVFSQIPPAMQNMAMKMAQGKAPYQTARQLGMSPQMYQTLLDAANDYATAQGDPGGFDATRWPVRASAYGNFTSGTIGKTITAGNTAISHVDKLNALIDDLPQGVGGNVPFVSYASRAMQDAAVRGTPGGQVLQQFEAERNLVAQEMTAFYRGAGGSEADVQAALANFDAAKSPEELHGAMAALVELMQSKVDALQDQWHSAMGPAAPDFPILSPQSQAAIGRVLGPPAVGAATASKTTPPPPSTPPVKVATDADYASLPSGTHFIGPDGLERVKP